MAYKYREEIVGKRFLSVSKFTKLKLGKIGEWGWRAGVIRATSHKDSTHPDLQVLVEYDGVEWHRREWISIYKDSLFHLFLVEHSLVWTERVDPLAAINGRTVLWPALSFTPLVAEVDMATNQQPLEFLLDRELAFRDYSHLQYFQEWDPKLPGLRDYPELRAAVQRWSELQDGQRILVTTPSVLVGYRVEVYRAQGTTQWYTAVIVSYNEATRDLTVTDDTVLEDHNEDPCIIQMRLIGDGVVESIMKGENVGITPRRSRSSAVLTQQQQQPSRLGRGTCLTPTGGSSSSSSGGSGVITRSYNANIAAALVNRKLRIGKLPPSGEHSPPSAEAAVDPTAQIPLEKGGSATNHTKAKADRKRKNAEAVVKPRGNSSASDFSNKEDLENKGNKKRNSNRSSKKVLEEANNSKLRCHVQVRVEDCLLRTSALRSCRKNSTAPPQVVEIPPARDEASDLQAQEATAEPKEQEEVQEAVLPDQEGVNKCVIVDSRTQNKEEVSSEPDDDRGRGGSRCSVVLEGKVSENEEKCNSGTAVQEEVSEPSVIVEDRTSSSDPVVRQPATSSQDDDDGPLSSSSPFSRMEIDSSATALLRFPDDRSDSGVSSLRSGSGDERSGSRSSALSSSDEPPQQQNSQFPPPLFQPSSSNSSSSDKLTTTPQETVRVWRDPSLLLVAEPHVRHINSVQHQTLLMSHPPPPAATAPSSSSAPAVVSQAQALALAQAHYPSVVPPPPPLLSPHPLHHHPHAVPHHLPPPGLFSQMAPDMLWNKRYPPLPVGTHLLAPTHPAPEDILAERERERVFRERQNQEARELEKQHKEREKERERAERERHEREKLERERQERQEREKMERERQERIEQERQDQERIEKQRAAQAVHQHFEESLRLAQQRRNMCWNLINSLPPPRGSGTEEERKREHDVTHQQQRLMAERLRQERYYPTGVQRPQSVPKVEYPPPAHSRVSGGKTSEKSTSHTVLPKVEPTFNLFGYPTYHPGLLSHDSGKVKQEQLKGSPSAGLTSLVTTKSASSSVGLDRERDIMLPNPPPLMSDIKNSVIVKNEGKSPHHPHDSSKAPPSHSPSPKLRAGDMVASQQPHYLPPTSLAQHKAAYEYRSPTQSPHHLAPRHTPSPHHAHMALEPQNLAGKGLQVHHRSSQQSSPHTLPHRQSPHTMQQQQQLQQPHPSPPEQRYSGSSGPSSLPYGSSKTATVGSYPYPSPVGHVTTSHYPLAAGGNVTAATKPKVSSPAPPHIYGKPGITTGTPVCRAQDTNVNSGSLPLPLTSKAPLTSSVSPSPYQQMSPHNHPPPPPPHQTPAGPPPPAHSRVSSSSSMVAEHRGIFDRMYPGGTSLTVKQQSQHQGSSPPSASAAPLTNPHSSPLQIPHQTSGHHLGMTTVFQTQPLDLGVSSERGNNRDDLIGSPKRKGLPMHYSPCIADPSKKRRCDQPNLPSQVVSQVALAQPLLSRVSEPSPLIASAATPITTVVNTAAYCTPAASSMMVSLSHDPLPGSTTVTISPNTISDRTGSEDGSVRSSSPGITAVCPTTGPSVTQQQNSSPVPFVPPANSSSPNLAAQQHTNTPHTPVKPQPPPSNVDSDKSNSPGPVRPTTGSSYPVHKLKKAWLQRHSGEDGTEDTTGIVGSGSCVTLPLNLGTNSSGAGMSKDNNSSGGNNMSSLQTVLSCKGKPVSSKGINRKGVLPAGNRDGSGVTLNGHAIDMPSSKHSRPDDSSSSDLERKSPPKRKSPKVKRKKGGGGARKTAEEKRKRLAPVAVHSESGSDSDKDSLLSDKDSDSGGSTTQSGTSGKKSANGGSGNGTSGGGGGSKEPRKRGRRPKSSKNDRGEEPRQKKPRGDPPAPQRNPFRKPPVSQLKKTGESFLQDGPCHEVAPKLAKCRECRWTPNQRSKNMPNIFCRFYAFRRLRYTKNGQLAIAGFSDPHRDASEEDLKLWLPLPDNPPADLDLEMSRFLLTQVGDQFCDLLEQEKESIAVHMSEEKTIAWKRVVQGVREMCDVCETTLFNFHWACSKCGFVVCIDCYKGRKNGSIKIWGEAGKDRDEFSWLFCTNRQAHEQEKLMLTQIIAGDSLLQLGKKVHDVRALCCIPQYCGCPVSKENPLKSTNGICKDLLKIFKNEPLNGIIKQEKREKDTEGSDKEKKNVAANGGVVKQEDQNSPLNWLADVALSSEDKKPCEDSGGSSSDSDEDKDGNYSTLRELLIRPSHKPNGSGSRSASPANNSTSSPSGGLNSNNVSSSANNNVNSSGMNSGTNSSGTSSSASPSVSSATSVASVKGLKKSRLDTLDEVISSVIEHSVQKEDRRGSSVSMEGKPPVELKHFVRRYNWAQKGREPLPIRIMTLTESKILYPDVPHSWLCDGKLLRLNDPNCEGNYRIFQDQWKRGQPVIVSDVTKHLDMSLWHPDSFACDFGEDKNDLINCMTGNLVPNQPMRKFWEGFEHFSRRLKDDRGNPMLLKLKDWPPGEDFAEMLPSRFSDLMRALPLAEYTHRTGRLNLASRLPECFVRPDLGPKMYNAYGSALYPTKGTTNLHLDISDAVNVMVYVGIAKDADNEEHIKEAFRAIDEAGCDILTRRRVREKGELPGALWHIYNARDADKIRDLLNKVAIERGARLEPHHDPIHDQSWYLDGPLRERLYKEYGVEGYAIVQCLGDSVFIPAGAPHQVRNLHNCIKVAEDFVSPENVSHCFHLTQEFRELSDTHTNHEDKLQIKNIIYHAVRDSLSVLTKIAGGNEEFIANLVSGPAAADNGTNSPSSAGGEPAPPNGSSEHNDQEANNSSHSNIEIKTELTT